MIDNCKHGLDRRFCNKCRSEKEKEPLQRSDIWITNENYPVIILRRQLEDNTMFVFLLDGSSGRLMNIHEGSFNKPADTEGSEYLELLLKQFHKIALQLGYIKHPERALTSRELGEEGPSHCYHCKTKLSFKKGSLGCTKCNSYVCSCGRCLCGYEGRNYRGEMFSQPQLPITFEERLQYVRVVMMCNQGK
jgi:hypothetical protein